MRPSWNTPESPDSRSRWLSPAGNIPPGRRDLLFSQILVEPVGQRHEVLFEIGPAVTGPLLDHQLARHLRFPEFLDDQFCLLDRDEKVGIAVNDERRRIIFADLIDG